MIYSIDLLAQLLSCFGSAVQLQDFPAVPQSRLYRDMLNPQIAGILRFPAPVKPVKKV